MKESELYTSGARQLQDAFDSRRIADRLEKVDLVREFDKTHIELIEAAPMFFLATVDSEGRPDVSYKGGRPGFVRASGASELAWPDYNGNGMFKSLGAIIDHPDVALLFLRYGDAPKKLRVHGKAKVSSKDPLMSDFPGAQLIVRLAVERIFDNCPRYLHDIQINGYSKYVPEAGKIAPVPDWKRNPDYSDALPRKDLDAIRDTGEIDN